LPPPPTPTLFPYTTLFRPIEYGNHSLAPANPGQQAITLHDITFCEPHANISVTNVSSVLSDPVRGTTNPVAIPGALVSYCILITDRKSTRLNSSHVKISYA